MIIAFLASVFSDVYGETVKVKVTVFPFNDMSASAIDLRISSVLTAELSKRDFIEPVPVDVIRKSVLEFEPAFLWTGRRGARDVGGIAWKIEPLIVEKVTNRTNADFAVYGDISWFNAKWAISAYVSRSRDNMVKAFTLSGDSAEELPDKLGKAAEEMADFIRKETVAGEAEEEVRRFLGGMYSLPVVVSRIEKLSQSYPDSLPLQAVLLDLYLRDKGLYKEKIPERASGIIANYDPSNADDTRYLLSLSLDPFDVLAVIHEEKGEWEKALDVREKAMRVFSFNAARHRAGIKAAKEKLKERGTP